MAPRKPENERKVNSFRPFGKIASHVDPMVLWTFLGLFLVSAVLLAFQMDSKEDCSNTDIVLSHIQNTNGKAYAVGEVITFHAQSADKNNAGYSWEFGDSSAEVAGAQVYHSFNKAGSYIITLTSGKCRWSKEVLVVMTAPEVAGNDPGVFPTIDGPSEIFAGRPATFSNKTPEAQSWSWRLLQDNAEIHTGSSVTYNFSGAGERSLSLIINNDSSHMVIKHITVFPARPSAPAESPEPAFNPLPAPAAAPEKPKEPEKTIPSISDDEFKFMLTQVTLKQKTATDFAQYLCNNLNARVVLNTSDVDNFTHFCSRIYGKKKFKIERVNLAKDEHGCVKEILIMYDRKKLLGIF